MEVEPGLMADVDGIDDSINVHAPNYDIPSIIDVDFDGDLDILAYYTDLNPCIRYYKNLSQELYGNSDSLEYELVSVCYGNFKAAATNQTAHLNTCCDGQVTNPQMVTNERPVLFQQDRHAGAAVLGLDLDADNLTDVVLGDAGDNNLLMLIMGGTLPNTNSAMVSYPDSCLMTSFDLVTYPSPCTFSC